MDAISRKRTKDYKRVVFGSGIRREAEDRAFRSRTHERNRFLASQREGLCKSLNVRLSVPTEQEVVTLIKNMNVVAEELTRGGTLTSCNVVEIPISSGALPFRALTHHLAREDHFSSSPEASSIAVLYQLVDNLSEIFTLLCHQDNEGCSSVLTSEVFQLLRVFIQNCLRSPQAEVVGVKPLTQESGPVTPYYAAEFETALFHVFCSIASVASILPEQLLSHGYLIVLLQVIQEPVSCRIAQVAAWALAALSEESPKGFLDGTTEARGPNGDAQTPTATLVAIASALTRVQLAVTTLSAATGASVLGSTLPLDGLEGLSRAIFSLMANLTQLHNADICLPILEHGVLLDFIPSLAQRISGSSAEFFLPADSSLRIALSEALWALTRCLDVLGHHLPELPHSQVTGILEPAKCLTLMCTVWGLAVACLERMGGVRALQADASDPVETRRMQRLVDTMAVDRDASLIERLNAQPTDLLLPCLGVLRLLCSLELLVAVKNNSLANSEQRPHQSLSLRLLSLEVTEFPRISHMYPFPSTSFTLRDGVLSRCLLSYNTAVKREGVALISVLAGGELSQTEFCLQYLPFLLKILADSQPYFVKRPAAVALNRMAFNHTRHFVSRVLSCSQLPSSEELQAFAVVVDPYSVRESAVGVAFNVTGTNTDGIGGRGLDSSASLPVAVSVVLQQLHRHQCDIPLIHIIFDFLEEVMALDPSLKLCIYKNGGVDIIESVQCVNDDSVFSRTVHLVEKYFDDFEELCPA